MQDSKLNPPLRKLGKHLENGSIVGSTPSTPAGNHARILDHHILEIRRRHPHAPLRAKHRLHDFLVVLPIGEEAKRNRAAHTHEDKRTGTPTREFRSGPPTLALALALAPTLAPTLALALTLTLALALPLTLTLTLTLALLRVRSRP